MNKAELREIINNHIQSEEFEQALKSLNNLFENYDSELSFEDWFNKGLVHFKLDQNEKAVECCNNAIKIEPLNFHSHSNKAICLLKLDKIKEAFESFKTALTINPNIAPAWFHLGFYHMSQSPEENNAYAKAVNCFRRAVKLFSDFENAKVYIPGLEASGTISYLLELASNTEDMETNELLKS